MTNICTIHIQDEVNCVIGGLRPEHNTLLYEKLGVFVDGYRYMPQFQLGRWDGKERFFGANGQTYVKLLDEIIPYLCTWGYEININDKRMPAVVVTERASEDVLGNPDILLRPYQVEVVNKLLTEGSGFGICATGSGKTLMTAVMALLLWRAGVHTIVVVPSTDLVTQTVTEFRKFLDGHGATIGEYSGSHKDIDNPIVIATWQSLQNVPHYMSSFDAFIIDEAHGAKAYVIKKLINVHGKHITHRYGVTGTFPKPDADKLSLRSAIGPIVAQVSAAWLIANGYLSALEIEPIETVDEDPELPDYSSERAYLTGHEDRLPAIAKTIMRKRDLYGNTLVLVNTIKQGRKLQQLIPGSVFLYGETEKELREQNYKEFANQDGIIVIASMGIASTGISIDRIFCEVLVDVGKSFIKCIQAVGRGLRRKGDKNFIHVVDIYSRLKFSKKHFKDRKKYYIESEYPVNAIIKLKY